MFGIHGAESFQSEYQKLVDTWLRRFTEIEMKMENEAQKEAEKREKKQATEAPTLTKNEASQTQSDIKEEKDIKVFDSEGNLLYGETESGKVCQITPEHIQKLEEASNLYIGNILSGLPSLQIEVDGETFFQSEYEEVLVNSKVNLADKIREWLQERKPSDNEFTLSEYEAYSELIEDPAAALLDDELTRKIVQEMVREKEREKEGEVKIYQAEGGESELVYGRVEQNFVDKFSREQIHQIEEAVMLSPGANFSGLSGLKVKTGNEVIFQVDELGNILVNQSEKLQQTIAQIQQPVQSVMPTIQSDYDDYNYGYSDEIDYDGYENPDDGYSNQPDYDGYKNPDDGYSNQPNYDKSRNSDDGYSDEPDSDESNNSDNGYSNQPDSDEFRNADNGYSNQPNSDRYENTDYTYSNQPDSDIYQNYEDNYTPDLEPQAKLEDTEIDNAIIDLLVELMIPIIEAIPSVHQEPEALQSENDFVDLLQYSSQQQQAPQNVILPIIDSELTQTSPYQTENLSSKSPSVQEILPQVQTEQKSGLDGVQEALKDMPEGSLKLVLQGMVTDMEEIAAQQESHPAMDILMKERNAVSSDLLSQQPRQPQNPQSQQPQQPQNPQSQQPQQPQNPQSQQPRQPQNPQSQQPRQSQSQQPRQSQSQQFQQFQQFQQSQQPQNPHWWQQISTKVETMVTAVRDNFIQYRAASTLKEFANQVGLQPGATYQGAEYNLSRQGKDYTLTDKQGNELLNFQSSVLGVKVDKSLPTLDNSHFHKTEQLRQDLKDNKQHTGSFIPEGVAEAKNLARINRITQTLIQYAAKQGGSAKIEGKFSYDWQANAAGNVLIQDKQGKALLAVSGGHIRSRLCEKDFQHFEQMLPALQNSAGVSRQQSQVKLPIASKGKQLSR